SSLALALLGLTLGDFRLWHSNKTPREFSHSLQWRLGLALRGHRCFLRPRSRCLRLRALRRSWLQVRAGQVAVGNAPPYNVGQHTYEPRTVVAGALVELDGSRMRRVAKVNT